VSTAQLDQLSKASSPDVLHFVCTALPGPASECVFVELETPNGNGSGLGEWITRPDGLVALVVPADRELDTQRLRADTAEAERDALRALLQRVVDSSVLSFEADAPEELESLEVDICAALNPNPEAESHE